MKKREKFYFHKGGRKSVMNFKSTSGDDERTKTEWERERFNGEIYIFENENGWRLWMKAVATLRKISHFNYQRLVETSTRNEMRIIIFVESSHSFISFLIQKLKLFPFHIVMMNDKGNYKSWHKSVSRRWWKFYKSFLLGKFVENVIVLSSTILLPRVHEKKVVFLAKRTAMILHCTTTQQSS